MSANVDTVREMRPYQQPTAAMRLGAPGKHGFLRMDFERDENGRSILRHLQRRAPLIVQQALYFDEAMPELPCVYILSSGGPNVDGDRYEQHICVRRDACAFVSTGAATKIAEMRHNHVALTQTFTLEEGAYLEFLPEPIIPCRHARYLSDTQIEIAPTATLFYAETFLPGRTHSKGGERFVYDILSVCTHAHRPDGTPLFRDKFIIRPAALNPAALGIMADYEVMASVLVLTPPTQAETILQSTPARIDRDEGLAIGTARLPNDCGLLFKALGRATEPVKKAVRHFCGTVRQCVKGCPVMEEFPWR